MRHTTSETAQEVPLVDWTHTGKQPDVRPSRSKKSWLSVFDILSCVVNVACLATAIATVWMPPVAVWLTQKYQLIVVGFLLSVMGICSCNTILSTLLMHTGRRRKTSLQDIDAMLRRSCTSSQTLLAYRLIILMMLVLPTGLGAAYETFQGGATTVKLQLPDQVTFGPSSTIGKQRIGDGLSLLPDVYVLFWVDPAVNRPYGYNLYVFDNGTAAVLDIPANGSLSVLQSKLKTNEKLNITATVNATISESVLTSADDRGSGAFWTRSLGSDPIIKTGGGDLYGANNALVADKQNTTYMALSFWNSTRGETCSSQALLVYQSRRLVNANWTITNDNITLEAAQIVSDTAECDQAVINNNYLEIPNFFYLFLGEYDYHNRLGYYNYQYPTPNGSQTGGHPPVVNTVPALAAAMVWARSTSLNTDRPEPQYGFNQSLLRYNKTSDDVLAYKTVPTLEPSLYLSLVLIVNPVLVFFCLSLKVTWLRDSPVPHQLTLLDVLAASNLPELAGYLQQTINDQPIQDQKRIHVVIGEHDGHLELRPLFDRSPNQVLVD